jgi:uncharacterized protein (TIGR02001 family)
MKNFAVALVALLALSVAGPAAALEVSGDAYAGIYSQYLWRGLDFSGNMPVLQGGMDLSAKGVTLSYWSNFQLIGDSGGAPALDAGEMTETDLTFDYTTNLTDKLALSVGNIFYTFNVPGATNEAYVGLSLDTLLSPSLKVYWDWDKARSDNRDGLFAALSIGHTFEVMDKVGLNLGALVSYNDESVGDYNNFHNYELSASIDYAPMENLTITPSLLYSEQLSSDASDLDSKLVSGLNVSYSF